MKISWRLTDGHLGEDSRSVDRFRYTLEIISSSKGYYLRLRLPKLYYELRERR